MHSRSSGHPALVVLLVAGLITGLGFLARTPSAPMPPTSATGERASGAAVVAAEPSVDAAITAFRAWLQASADTLDQAALAEGERLARERRPAFRELIRSNPERALREAVPMVVRQKLPASILALLEARVSGRGSLERFAISEPIPGQPAVTHEVRLRDRSYQAFVYGRRAEPAIRKDVLLHGVAIDSVMAVAESPIRPIEIGEVPPADADVIKTCAVSGISTAVEPDAEGGYPAITEETPAALEGYIIRYYCDGGHIVQEAERLLDGEFTASESLTGGFTLPDGSVSSPTTSKEGYRTILYMRCIFPDDLKVMQTETEAVTHLADMNDYFHEISYGKLYFVSTITPVILLPRTSAYYKEVYAASSSTTELINDAKEQARRMGFPIEAYQHHIMIYSNTGPGNFGGRASAPGSNMWLKSTSDGTFWHEMGHNLGPIHANFWDTGGASSIGPGKNGEYGNSFDVMGGSGSGRNGHFNASFKNQIGWLTSDLFTDIVSPGTYRIFQFDQAVADVAKRYALRIRKDSQRDYWVEFRQRYTTNNWIFNGVHLNWDRWGTGGDTTTSGANGGSHLIDTTPGSPDNKNDAALVLGRTFSDTETGIHITPVSKNATTPPSMDVVVAFDDPDNTAPTLNLTSSATSAATGVGIQFTATATDAEGDPLSYHWDFGDRSVHTSNAATATKSWSTVGHYAVQCTVSDHRGGATRRTILVTIGSPSTFTLRGTVTDGTNPLPDVGIHTGTLGNTSRKALTDSDGAYVITGLASGSHTVTPVLDTWSFTAQSVSVDPSQTGIDFTGSPANNVVTVEAIDAEGSEVGSDPVVFRLSRTGDAASLATVQTVTVLVEGSASTADYTLSPAGTSVSPFRTWDIPAGESTLDITATITADTAIEAEETLRFVVIPTGGVSTGRPQNATATLQDEETTLPGVSLYAVDADLVENDSADRAVFEIRRTGSTASSLNVTVNVNAGSTATSNVDFTKPPATIQIPAGEKSVRFEVPAIDDSVIEGREILTFTLPSNGTHRAQAPTTASAVLHDDEINIVTITATEGTASESGTNPGIFTLTRTGDTAEPLQVEYVIGGTAQHGTDYQPLPGSVTFAAGSDTAEVRILPVDDDLGEGSQTVILHLRSRTDYTVGTPFSASVLLNDNDGAFASVIATDGLATEGSGADTAAFRFTLRGGSGAKEVKFSLGGSATLGSDYTLSGTVSGTNDTISVNANGTATLTVTPINDSLQENTETVTITLLEDASYMVDPFEKVSSIILRDNNLSQSVTVAVTPDRISETSTNGKFYVARNGATTNPLTVHFTLSGSALEGTDYTLSETSPLTIPASSAGIYVTITPTDDSDAEPTETLTLTATPDSGYGLEVSSATVSLTDDDSTIRQVRFPLTASTHTLDEGDGSHFAVVNLDASHTEEITVDYSVLVATATGGGQDFTLNQGTLTFPPGETQQSIEIQVRDDTIPEREEYLVIQLTNPSNATVSSGGGWFSLYILDNEPRVSVTALDPAANENGDTATFRISRTGPLASPLSVPFTRSGTATNGSDYNLVGSPAVIPANASFIDLTLNPTSSGGVEGMETVTLTLTPHATYTVASPSAATASLFDSETNGAPVIQLLNPRSSTAAIPAATGLLLETSVQDDGSAPALQWSKVSGPGTVTFGSANAASTTATFSSSGAYVIRLTADDGAQSSTLDLNVQAGVSGQTWTSTDVGGGANVGQSVFNDGSILIQSAGNSLGDGTDSLRFVHLPLPGDGEIIARARRLLTTNSNARLGLMMRESTASSARAASIMGSPTGSGGFITRTTAGGNWSAATYDAQLAPLWLRLVRSGDEISGYQSLDGVNWIQRGATTTVNLGSLARIGLVAMSNTTTKPTVGEFDSVFVSTSQNSGPLASAGSDQTSEAGAVITLTGIAIDDAKPLVPGTLRYRWIQMEGPPSNPATPDAASTTVQVNDPGVYTFRFTADDGDVTTFDDMTVTVASPLSTVTIAATDSSVAEQGLDPGSFTLSRTLTDGPLTVRYNVTGTATSGSDFAILGTQTVIPDGSATVSVTVTPLSDTVAEGPETVILTLAADPAYVIGTDASATVTLADLPIDHWRHATFGSNANTSSIAGDLADDDKDGLVTLLEYALDLSVTNPDSSPITQEVATIGMDRFLRLIVPKNAAATDVAFTVEASGNLTNPGTWSSTGLIVEENSANMLRVRDNMPVTPSQPRFMRLRVTRQP